MIIPRPPKWRHVEYLPEYNYFKPAGVPLRELDEIVINVEELEAIRLKDREGLEQEACAEKMKVSRPTFQRILSAARSKLSEALVEGKAIRIEGGNFKVTNRRFKCIKCEHQWNVPFGTGHTGKGYPCPKCNNKEAFRVNKGAQGFPRCKNNEKKDE